MSEKQKDKKNNKKNIPKKDALDRMNFLYQLAHEALKINNQPLARFYIYTLRGISKRLVIKIDPTIKRTICKNCNSLLVPGITMKVRISPRRETHVNATCLYCGNIKRFLAREGCDL